jgi:sugar lactone lactonase YvrE
MRHSLAFLPVAALLIAGCAPEPESPTAEAPPPPAPTAPPPSRPLANAAVTVIEAERGGFIPEGIEYDQTNGRFLSGSLAEGTIFEIERDGSVVPFIRDPELVSSVGIEADEPRNRLLVANSDRAAFAGDAPGQAKLGVYNLTTGERLAMVDLGAVLGAPAPPKFFANDVTVDGDGNAYVTDTMNGVVYRVTNDYQASLLHRFTDLPQGAQLNGIVYHDGGYLLVVAGEHTYKVPVANPAGTTKVNVVNPVAGQDGIVLTADGSLVATSNSATEPRLVAFRSDDNWTSAQRTGVAVLNGQATTAAVVDDEIWAVHPHFADAEPPMLERGTFQ